MKTSTKIILGSAVGVFLLLGALLVGGFAFIHITTVNSIEAEKKVRAAGAEFGKTTDQAGCMERTFTLEAPFTSFDHSRMFIRECLRSSRPTPNFCRGVPPPLSNLKWVDEECRRIGRDTPLCQAAFDGKMFFCEVRDGK